VGPVISWIAWCRAGELEKGIESLRAAVQIYRAGRFVIGELLCKAWLGEGYLLAGEYDKANEILDEHLQLAERCGGRWYEGYTHRLLGEVALKTNPDEAAPHFEKAISIFREIKAENELALAYSGMGRFHRQQGNTEQARKYLNDALEIFERLGTLIEPDKVRNELAELPVAG